MTAKGGEVKVIDVDAPEQAQPGEEMVVRVEMRNDNLATSPWDEDRCVSRHAGFKAQPVVVGPTGEEHKGGTVCLPQSDLVRKFPQTEEVTVPVPDRDGTHNFQAFAEMVNSGQRTDRHDVQVRAYSQGEEPQEPPEDGGEGFQFPWEIDDDDGDGSNPFSIGLELGTKEKLALGGGGLLLAAIVLRPYASAGATAAEAVA